MEKEEYLKELPTEDMVKELERRYPAGFIMAFLTDDPSFNKTGFTEYFRSFGPSSSQRGLADNLADYISDANAYSYFDSDISKYDSVDSNDNDMGNESYDYDDDDDDGEDTDII